MRRTEALHIRAIGRLSSLGSRFLPLRYSSLSSPPGCPSLALRQSGLCRVASLAVPEVATDFPNGSVSFNGIVGAAAVNGKHIFEAPVLGFVFQTELVAIFRALTHTLPPPTNTLVHTDCPSAFYTLPRPVIPDNLGLVTHGLYLTAALPADLKLMMDWKTEQYNFTEVSINIIIIIISG